MMVCSSFDRAGASHVRRWPASLILLLAVCGFGVGAAHASDDKKALRAQMARMQQLQQAAQALEAEKGQLSAEKSRLEGDLKSSRTELERARSAVSRREAQARQEVQTLQAEQARLLQQLDEAQRQIEALRTSLLTAQRTASQSASDLSQTQAGLQSRIQALGECETRNQALYDLNVSLVARLEKAAGSTIWTGGPFTMFSKVKGENEAAELRDKVEEQRASVSVKP